MNWRLWRVVVSGRFHATLTEVRDGWTLTDLYDAHAVLDALEDAEARAAAERKT